MTPMTRAWWWAHKDAARLLGRARHSSGGHATLDELRYMRAQCRLLLTGPLPVDETDAAQLRVLLVDLEDALNGTHARRDGAA